MNTIIKQKDFYIQELLYGSSNQRKSCRCPSNKTELLNRKTRCPHGCIYCYWHDSELVQMTDIFDEWK